MWVSPEDHKAVGQCLADARKRRGLTQQAVARALRKPQSFISSYEAGQRRVDVLELILIASALGIDAIAIFREISARWGGLKRRPR